MKRFLFITILLWLASEAVAQRTTTRYLSLGCNIQQVGSSSGKPHVSCNCSDPAGTYDASNVAVGDTLYFNDGGVGYALPIDSIVTPGVPTLVVRADWTGLGLVLVPTGRGGISRSAVNGLKGTIAGLTAADNQYLEEDFVSNIGGAISFVSLYKGTTTKFAADTDVAPDTTGAPSTNEIEAWNYTTQDTNWLNSIIFYTGGDDSTAVITYIYFIDGDGNASLLESPSDPLNLTRRIIPSPAFANAAAPLDSEALTFINALSPPAKPLTIFELIEGAVPGTGTVNNPEVVWMYDGLNVTRIEDFPRKFEVPGSAFADSTDATGAEVLTWMSSNPQEGKYLMAYHVGSGTVDKPDFAWLIAGDTDLTSADIVTIKEPGGVSDGDKTDIDVSGNVWTIDTSAVTTVKIADDAVTLAKQAAGTANRLMGFDGSGNPSEIAAGTNVTISGGTISTTSVVVADTLDALPAAAAFKAADRVVLTDSTGLFGQLVDQMRDSTIFSVPNASDIVKLSTTLKTGDRIIVKNTGLTYYVQPDSVQYYATDDSLVVDLTGKYAVVDLSDKRIFRTYQEFKKLAPLCRFTGKDENIIAGYEQFDISATAPTISNAYYPDTIANGYWIDTFNVAYQGGNLVRWSELPTDGGSSTTDRAILFAGGVRTNFEIGPSGRKNAAALVGTGSCFIYHNPIQSNTSYTVSFWAKLKNGATGVTLSNFKFSGGSNGTNVQINDPSWKRYSVSITTPTANATLFSFAVPSVAGDTILITQVQVEQGGLSDYKQTAYMKKVTGTKMFINRGKSLIKNGVLDIGSIAASDGASFSTTTDRYFLQSAIDFCAEGNRCNEIKLGKAVYQLDSTIVMRKQVRLVGPTSTRRESGNPDYMRTGGAVIVVPAGFKGSNLFEFTNPAGSETLAGSGLENIAIDLFDTVTTVIYCNEIQDSRFENIIIGNNTGGEFSIGMDLTTDAGSDQYDNSFKKIQINDATNVGIQYQGSTENFFEELDLTSCSVGFRNKGGNKCEIRGLKSQGNDTSLVMWGGHLNVSGFYTEGSGQNGGSVVKMLGGRLRIENSTLQVSDASTDTLLNLQGGDWLSLENVEIRTEGGIGIGDSFGALFLENVTTRSAIVQGQSADETRRKIKTINIFNHTTGAKYRNYFSEIFSENSNFSEGHYYDSNFNDTINISDIYIAGTVRNYLSYSDSLALANNTKIGAPDTVTVRNNTVIAPDGTMTAETLVYTGDDIGGSTVSLTSQGMLDSFSIGDSYVFSVWVKPFFDHPFELFTIRPYGNSLNDVGLPKVYLPQGEWTKIFVSGEIVSTTGSGCSLRLKAPGSSMVAGDSLAVWRMQIEPGIYPTTSTYTTSSGINTSNAKINFQSLELNGALVDSSGSPGTAGQVPISTVTGWHWGPVIQSSDFTATVTQSGSDTLQNGAICYGYFERNGNYVDLDVRIEVAFTSTGNANTFYFDPPIASNFTTEKTDVIGRGGLDTQALSSTNIPQQRCLAFASTSDDKIGISVDPPDSLTYPDNRMYITVQLRYVIQ